MDSYALELTRNLLQFQKAGYLCDTVISVDGGQLKAHSAVLAAASPVFSIAFRADPSAKERMVLMPGVELSVAEVILQYMYTGNFDWEGRSVPCSRVTKLQQAVVYFGINLQIATQERWVLGFYSMTTTCYIEILKS